MKALKQLDRTRRIFITGSSVVLFSLSPVLAQEATKADAPTGATDNSKDPKESTPADTSSASTEQAVDLLPSYSNWVVLGGGYNFVSGDKGQFERRQDMNAGPFGGVEDFRWQQFIGKDWTFTIDGHALFGNHDYALKLSLMNEKLGYIKAGYTDFRTWYDGIGGFYPPGGVEFQPDANELYIDRRSAWFEAGLTLPDLPKFIFRYEYDSREGLMDTTIWGQTTLTPAGNNVKIVPGFLGINESRNIFSFDVNDTFDETTADLGVHYEIDRIENYTYLDQNPNQTSNAYITQQDLERDNLFSVHGLTETIFDQQVTFTTGFAVTTVDANYPSGSRVYGQAYGARTNPNFVNNGSGYTGMWGGGSTKDYVGNLNLMLTPIPNLTIVPSLRFEYEDSNLFDNFSNTSGNGGGFTSTQEAANTNNWYGQAVQNVEARYAGFQDWSLYSSAEISENWGNNSWDTTPVLNGGNFNQDYEMIGQKYTVGANWYPLAQVNVGSQYYHQIHQYTFSNHLSTPEPGYPSYLTKQDFTTDDMNIRATWQALSNLSLVTRYDFQCSTVDTWGIPNGGTQAGGVESATYINHIISGDATWTPIAPLYLQIGGSYVLDTLETPVAGSAGINNLVLNGSNNYWTVDASLGYEIDPKTHFQLQYSFYNAYNYTDNSAFSVPYGAGGAEHSLTATLTRQISKNVKVNLKYGFYRNRDDTSGSQANYDAHMVYVSTEFGF